MLLAVALPLPVLHALFGLELIERGVECVEDAQADRHLLRRDIDHLVRVNLHARTSNHAREGEQSKRLQQVEPARALQPGTDNSNQLHVRLLDPSEVDQIRDAERLPP